MVGEGPDQSLAEERQDGRTSKIECNKTIDQGKQKDPGKKIDGRRNLKMAKFENVAACGRLLSIDTALGAIRYALAIHAGRVVGVQVCLRISKGCQNWLWKRISDQKICMRRRLYCK